MKKPTKYIAIILALCSLSISALADESGLTHDLVIIGGASSATDIKVTDETSASDNVPQETSLSEDSALMPDTVYDLDLDGDGQTEAIYYTTYTDESQQSSNAVLEIYKDGQLYWSYSDPDWSYYWDMAKFTLADGKTYFLTNSRSDNDWNSKSLVLSKDSGNDSLTVLADLTQITRRTEELAHNPLSGWSRVGYAALLSSQENIVTVPWTDNTKSTGNMTVYVDYKITEEEVSPADTILSLDENRTWTAWYEFDVFTEPGSSEVSFHVSADDVVSLSQMTSIDGKTYLKCINAKGQEGWFPDAEEYLHSESSESPDGFYQGYFKECIFAG